MICIREFQDGGLGSEPIVVFIVPMLFNLICAVTIATKIAARFGISFFRGVDSIQPMTICSTFYSIRMLLKLNKSKILIKTFQ